MPFPISIRFKKRLKVTITSENQPKALRYIQKTIQDKAAGNIVIENNQVSYKGSTQSGRRSLFGEIRGTFTLINGKDGRSYLIYEFKMYHLFIVTPIMAVAFGLLSHHWWLGIIAFLWLCGMNWIIYLIRNEALANELATGIDSLHGILRGEDVDPEGLKHWM
jgi:hypothetical protein